jgi:hypothetical protein
VAKDVGALPRVVPAAAGDEMAASSLERTSA